MTELDERIAVLEQAIKCVVRAYDDGIDLMDAIDNADHVVREEKPPHGVTWRLGGPNGCRLMAAGDKP